MLHDFPDISYEGSEVVSFGHSGRCKSRKQPISRKSNGALLARSIYSCGGKFQILE